MTPQEPTQEPVDLFEYQGKQFFAALRHPGVGRRGWPTPSTRRSPRPTRPATRWWSRPRCRSAAAARPAASSWPTNADEVARARRQHPRHGHQGPRRASGCGSSTRATSPRSTTPSFTLDRAAKKHLGMLSAQGGVEIETVAEEDPDAIAKI